MDHFSHEHPLILKPEERRIDDGTYNSDLEITSCDGCSAPILGPFYSCVECGYFLHKVCAELPMKMDHPMHPQHTLTLHSDLPYKNGSYHCNLCSEDGSKFVYNCSICSFDLDIICASASHTLVDKCHPHPLIPIQIAASFHCQICRTKEIGVSYKCKICPFWVHQNCTLLPDTVTRSYHVHHLTLLPSVPFKYYTIGDRCSICHDLVSSLSCVYYCLGCLFCAHVGCALSETTQSSSRPRDQKIENDQDLLHNGQYLVLPLEQQKTTELISQFVEKFIDRDVITGNKIDHFGHKHPLFLIDEQLNEKFCEACAVRISPSLYGCIECDYFLHKCCAELPKHIFHPSHPGHKFNLLSHLKSVFLCKCCYQWGNGYRYECSVIPTNGKCEFFSIDIKCASLLSHIRHEAHKHPLTPKLTPSTACTACNHHSHSDYYLQCESCSFNLCFRCAMAPSVINHRYDKHPFTLAYFPPANHYHEYICELCEGELNPKLWHYKCGPCDQFAHLACMVYCCADSNIKYGKLYHRVHEHKLSLVSFTYNYHACSLCRISLNKKFTFGFECIPCNYKVHYFCDKDDLGTGEIV